MFNVNELTSRMAKMSDAQLRQYAQLHKNDPYTLALAASESKRRAQLRASGQPQAPEAPTVAEQALAQMGAPQLPEEQGIGVLPAQNMMGMTDGGIAGYADGGMVAFAGEGPSLVSDKLSDAEKAELLRYQQENFDRLYGLKDWASGIKNDVVDWFTADRSNIPWESKSPMIKYGTPKHTGIFNYERPDAALTREREARGIASPTVANTPPVSDVYPDETQRGSAAGIKPQPAPAQTATARPPSAFANNSTGRVAASKQPGAVKGPDSTSGFVPSAPGNLDDILGRLKDKGPGTAAYDTLKKDTKEGYATLQAEREASKPKGQAYEGLEALLAKEEEKAKGKEERNLNMALINAGLAIAGGKSQYALQNIAEGAQVGTKQYQEGLDKLEAAALERRKQSALIEEARRAEARGDWKEANDYKQKAFEAGLGVDRSKIEAIQKIWDTSIKNATDIFNTQNTLASADRRALMQEQGQNQRAREQNATHLQGQQIMAAAYSARAADRGSLTPALLLKEYNDALQKDLLGDFKKQFPTFQHYMIAVQQATNPTLISELPPNANVRK